MNNQLICGPDILLGIYLCFGALITKDCIWRTLGTTPHPLTPFCVSQISPSNLMELHLKRGRAELMVERGRDGDKEDSS